MAFETNSRWYQQIVEGTPEAVIVADTEGVIRAWTAAAEAMFGWSASEALGQTLDLIVPEPQRARHWEGYRSVVASGRSRYGRDMLAVPAMRKDSTRISLEFYVVLLHDDAGNVEGIAALMRDVTERWQRDRATQQRVRELEAQLTERTGDSQRQSR